MLEVEESVGDYAIGGLELAARVDLLDNLRLVEDRLIGIGPLAKVI
jgi:hypothetical protein